MPNRFRDELFHKFMHTSRKIAHRTHRKLEAVDLYRGQPPLLFALWEKDEQSRKELGEVLRIQPATVTKMVQRLSQNGFLTSKADAHDSRISRVCLTEKGKAIEPEVKGIYDGFKVEAFKDFSEEELRQLATFLDRINDNLGMDACGGRCNKGEGKNHG